ncbi:MAG: DUF3552 domain-containing protein, partial [Candidatus Eremiobacteraeota bacterium]|nr:DUF3552 domain-containing protein [Candidatus Eremiobacteraeota bacterium]
MGAIVLALGFMLGRGVERQAQEASGQGAQDLLEKAKLEAEGLRDKHLLDAQRQAQELRAEAEKENNERRQELRELEKRLVTREEFIERKQEQLDRREERLGEREDELRELREQAEADRATVDARLEEAARMSAEQARQELFSRVEKENELALARSVRQAEEAARDEADRKARRIITTSIQKWAADQVVESTVSVVNLPTDEMKGRIIG